MSEECQKTYAITPTSGLQHRAAIMYHRFTEAPDLYAIVSYIEFRKNKVPRITFAGCHVFNIGTKIIIGGAQQATFYKNIAIGRRFCPACYSDGHLIMLKDKGYEAGKCPRCSTHPDYLNTSLPPYFQYFHHQECSEDLHITGSSSLRYFADTLKKELLLRLSPIEESIPLPRLKNGKIIFDKEDHPIVFACVIKKGLKGYTANVKYNLWSNPKRQQLLYK